MHRRRVIRHVAAAGLLLSAACLGVRPSRPVARVGLLGSVFRDSPETAEVVCQRLGELGWVEGDNLVLEWHYTAGTEPYLDELVADLVRRVDIVVVNNEPHARAVQRASGVMPIVLAGHPDPVATGLVASLDRPGGTITGNGDSPGGVIFQKRVELLKATHPGMSVMAILFNSAGSPAVNAVQLPAIVDAARRFGVDVYLAEARAEAQVLDALNAAARAGVDGLFVIHGPVNLAQREVIIRFAANVRLPAMYQRNVWVQSGGLMSYGGSVVAQHRQVAEYVDRILRGAKPADLPIRQATVIDFEVNLRAADGLGIEFAPWVATQVTRWVS